MFRLLGMCFIEDRMKDKMEKNPEFKKEVKRLANMAMDAIKDLYNDAKKDNMIKEGSLLEFMGKAMEEIDGKKEDDVEKARKLLESKGYRLIRENNDGHKH